MSNSHRCRCEELAREFEALRKLLESERRERQEPKPPRLSVQLKDAPAVLGIKPTSFDDHVKHEVPCVRRGSMRLYAIKDLERWLDQNKDLAAKLRRVA